MWHKKRGTVGTQYGSGLGTGVGDETVIGQCFYTDPYPSTFTNTSSTMLITFSSVTLKPLIKLL